MKKVAFSIVLILLFCGVAIADTVTKKAECKELVIVDYILNGKPISLSSTSICTYIDVERNNICYITFGGDGSKGISCVPLAAN